MFHIGTKVRVKDFPPPVGQSVSFSFNGLVGVVKGAQPVGSGLDNKTVYAYLVYFEDVEVPFSRMNPKTNKIDRGIERTAAQNYFEEAYLESAQ